MSIIPSPSKLEYVKDNMIGGQKVVMDGLLSNKLKVCNNSTKTFNEKGLIMIYFL
jgi:hypothetical protein